MVMALPLVVVPSAHATVDVPSASITKVGYYPGVGYMVMLDETSDAHWGGSRQFYLSSSLGKEGFATALTAFSNTQTVWVRIGGTATAGSLISIIYINNN